MTKSNSAVITMYYVVATLNSGHASASVLLTQLMEGSQQRDLDDAVSFYRNVLEVWLAPHPDLAFPLNNLALSLGH
jgi:hypothetical protein